jgi:hypothetical protein
VAVLLAELFAGRIERKLQMNRKGVEFSVIQVEPG